MQTVHHNRWNDILQVDISCSNHDSRCQKHDGACCDYRKDHHRADDGRGIRRFANHLGADSSSRTNSLAITNLTDAALIAQL
jgi:hypothetical protein